MYKYKDAVVLIPVNMGSSWTIKKSQKHLSTPGVSFPIIDQPQPPPNHLHPSTYEGTRDPVGPVLFPLLISSQPISSKCSTRESSLLWTCSRNGLGPATPCRTISRRSNLRYTRTSIMKRMIWFDDDLPLVVTNKATNMFHDIKRHHSDNNDDCEHDIKTIMTINRTILMTT